MTDLFDKLSTLVNAQVNDFLGRNPKSPLARIALNADEAEKDPRRSAQSLRDRLEEAIEYEDVLQAKIDEKMNEVLELDHLVDKMLHSGDEYSAQRLQGQLNMKQQQLTMAESELRDHRLLTQHLMQELSALEMALDNQEWQARGQPPEEGQPSGRTRIPVDGKSALSRPGGMTDKSIVDSVSDKFNETRANLENLLHNAPKPNPPDTVRGARRFEIVDEEPDPRTPKPPKTDKSEMNARLSRLSKPSDDE